MAKHAVTALIAALLGGAITFAFLASHYGFGFAEEKDPRVVEVTIESKTLEETRPLTIHLPRSYERQPEMRYPLIVVLDGGARDAVTAEAAELMASIEAMPEAIVVGIPNTHRNRDLTPAGMAQESERPEKTGEADRFLEFLEHELIPYIDRTYRTTGYRVLSGYSRGGLFVVDSLLRNPNLFQARFAFSPALWRDNEAIIERATTAFAEGPGGGFLFMSLGDRENEKMKKSYDRMVRLLEERAPEGLTWRAGYTAGGTHQTTADLAVPVALAALRDQWSNPGSSRE